MLGTARKILLFDGGAIAPVVEQDTGSQTTGGATSDTATFANTTVTGRGVIVVLSLKGARQVSSVTDNKGNTYIRVGRAADSTDCSVEMWYSQPITGGASHQITVTFDGTTYCVWGALEASRVKGGGAFLDTRTVNTTTRGGSGSSAAISISSGLPRSANELFVAMVGIAGGGADAGIDTPSAWTNLTLFQDYDGTMAGHGDHRINVNANTVNATWTNDTTVSPYAAIIAGFRGENGISGGIAPPTNTVAPAITGTTTEGQTLTCSTGTWTGSPVSYTYQWKDDGVAISGAVASTYVLTASEVGATITCTVTAYNDGGSASATSAGVGPVIAAFSGVLDSLSLSPTGAFSCVRRLRAGYTGPLIRVARASDSTEQDIGYDGDGNLDQSALTTFCSGTDGFVATYYDQSGNANHFTVSTPVTFGPQIVSSGSVITTINSKPTMDVGTANTTRFLAATSTATPSELFSTTGLTIFGIARPTSGYTAGGSTTGYGLFGHAGTARTAMCFFNRGGIEQLEVVVNDGSERAQAAAIGTYPDIGVWGLIFRGGMLRGFNNGASDAQTTGIGTLTLNSGTDYAWIGRSTVSGYFRGQYSELFFFNTGLSNGDVNALGGDLATLSGESWTTVTW